MGPLTLHGLQGGTKTPCLRSTGKPPRSSVIYIKGACDKTKRSRKAAGCAWLLFRLCFRWRKNRGAA